MKIGIIGSGNMGRSLGILWAEQGHEVFFGARTTEKGQAVATIAGHITTRKAVPMTKQRRLERCCYTQSGV